MRLPEIKASAGKWRRFGRYTLRRCHISGDTDLKEPIAIALETLRARVRAQEDLEDIAGDATADRDGLDRSLDSKTRRTRQELANRGLDAIHQAPYTDIFGEGIGYYTMATLSEQIRRYTEFAERLTRYLTEDDPVRITYVPQILSDLELYKAAREAETKADIALAIGRSETSGAKKELGRMLEKTYGLLVDRYGKSDADDFFRRTSIKSTDEQEDTDDAVL